MIQLVILFLIFGALVDVVRYATGLIRSKRPKPPIGAIALLCLCSLPVFFGAYIEATSPAPSSSPRPSVTRTPRPSIIAQSKASPTTNPCLKWNQIRAEHAGQDVCVYGAVQAVYSTNETWTRIRFTDKPNQFFLYSTNYTFEELAAGSCVLAYGEVELYESTPFINIRDQLRHCGGLTP